MNSQQKFPWKQESMPFSLKSKLPKACCEVAWWMDPCKDQDSWMGHGRETQWLPEERPEAGVHSLSNQLNC